MKAAVYLRTGLKAITVQYFSKNNIFLQKIGADIVKK